MKQSGARVLALLLCLAIAALACLWSSHTPKPLAVDAPPAVFSAERAMVDDRIIAARPHPEGSAEAKVARDYIFSRMAALGLNPRRVQGEAVEVFPRFRGRVAAGGRVENLIGVLAGTDPKAPALLLMAHSDSVPGSPGAADDAAGVISALEIVRALKAAGPQRRDVAVLITDGEETGLLGARAFFADHDPLLKHIGLVVNMEARGGGGRAAMFETGARNGAAMALFGRAVKNADALSLMSEIYKYMPNSTDFTVSKAAGFPGYNFAFTGEEFDYHSPSSTPAVLDQGSVQHMGEQALAIVRGLEAAPALPSPAPDAIYSDVFGGPVLVYPPLVGWLIIAVSALLAGIGAVVGARRAGEGIRLLAVLQGAGAALLTLVLGLLVLHTAGRLLGTGDVLTSRRYMAAFDLYFVGAALLATGAWARLWFAAFAGRRRWSVVAIAAVLALLSCISGLDLFALVLALLTAGLAAVVLRRPLPLWSGWLGVMGLGLVLTIALQWISPPLSVSSAWPVLLGAVGMAATAALGRGRVEGAALLGAGLFAALAAAHLGHLAGPIFVAIGTSTPEALALVPFLGGFALYPLLSGERTWWSRGFALGGVGVGVLILAYVALVPPWSARTPRAVQAFYLYDAAAGRAYRASALPTLDPWSRAAVSGGGRIDAKTFAPMFDKLWLTSTAAAPALADLVPTHAFEAAPNGDERTVRIAAGPGVRDLRLFLRPTVPLQDVRLDGRTTELKPTPGGWTQLRWNAPSGPVTLSFRAKTPGALDLRYQEIVDSLPPGVAFPPKPANTMPLGSSDKTVVVGGFKTIW
jgi:hypothetical protein